MQWHIQFSRDEAFSDVTVDAKVSLSVTTIAAKELTAGLYFARVSAIDADKFEGPPGAPRWYS